MPFATKVLWIENLTEGNLDKIVKQIEASKVTGVCVRTESLIFPGLIAKFKTEMKLKVLGWKYPHVLKPAGEPDPSKPPKALYAAYEADYVVQTLIPAGLDGYIMDIESHDNKDGPDAGDWDRQDLARDIDKLAESYTTTLKKAAINCGRPFSIGFTSHSNCFNVYPKTPWDRFKAVTDVMYPQTYWCRYDDSLHKCVAEHQDPVTNARSPEYSMDFGFKNYSIWNKPIIPMAGEIACASVDEIKRFGGHAVLRGVTEGHFYVSAGQDIDPSVLDAISKL